MARKGNIYVQYERKNPTREDYIALRLDGTALKKMKLLIQGDPEDVGQYNVKPYWHDYGGWKILHVERVNAGWKALTLAEKNDYLARYAANVGYTLS